MEEIAQPLSVSGPMGAAELGLEKGNQEELVLEIMIWPADRANER